MLKMTHLSKAYRTEVVETPALANFSINVREGEFVAITSSFGFGQDDVSDHRGPARGIQRRGIPCWTARTCEVSTTISTRKLHNQKNWLHLSGVSI